MSVALLVGGCADLNGGRETPVQVWAVPDHTDVFPDSDAETENEVYSEARRLVRLTAGINETIAFQIVCAATSDPVTMTSATMTELRHGDSVIHPDSVTFYRELRVLATEFPTWYLRLTPHLGNPRHFVDPLVPLTAPRGALPITVQPDACQALWTDIHIPSGTPDGVYRGKLILTFEGGIAAELDINLTVWPFAIPHARHLPVIAGVRTSELCLHHLELQGRPYSPTRITIDDPAFHDACQLVDGTVQLLHEHRFCPVLTDVRPQRTLMPDGSLELDWADYDRLVASIITGSATDHRVPAFAWPLPIDDHNPPPHTHGGAASSQYRDILQKYVSQCTEHFRQNGWLDRHYVWMNIPQGGRGEQYREYHRVATAMKQVQPELNIACPLTPYSMEQFGWRDDPFIDVSMLTRIWATAASQADAERLAGERAAGRRTWLRPDQPPFVGSMSMMADATHARSLPWLAYRFGHEAIFLPHVNLWPDDGMPRAEDSHVSLIWPGKPFGLDRPIPSIRMKRLRRGLYDYELLWLMERNARPAIAAMIAEDLHPYGGTAAYGEHLLDGRPGGWADDPMAWAMARRLMAAELIDAIQAETRGTQPMADDVERFQQHVDWARLAERVRHVRVELEGTRVRFQGGEKPSVLLEAITTVFNATRRAVTGKVDGYDWPDDWTLLEETPTIQQLLPARAARRTVKATAADLQPTGNGIVPMAVSIENADGTKAFGRGRICAMTSHHLDEPLVIDGKLDDWPLGMSNIAGDFLLVGTQDVPKQRRFSPDRPSQPTLVFVCDDDDYLYIAFNCRDDGMSQRRITRSNVVAYDGLWPRDEDLVEVIVDPTGEAVDASELIHIVVKANGAVVAERGVPCLTPVAAHQPGALSVTAAIDDQTQSDRWSVEIRIPLRELGLRGEVWGVDFARFLPRLGEYSCWSGARRFLYSPVTLGNMVLRPVE